MSAAVASSVLLVPSLRPIKVTATDVTRLMYDSPVAHSIGYMLPNMTSQSYHDDIRIECKYCMTVIDSLIISP